MIKGPVYRTLLIIKQKSEKPSLLLKFLQYIYMQKFNILTQQLNLTPSENQSMQSILKQDIATQNILSSSSSLFALLFLLFNLNYPIQFFLGFSQIIHKIYTQMTIHFRLSEQLVKKRETGRQYIRRALEGNRQDLKSLCDSIQQLINSNHYVNIAYDLINQLLISADPAIVEYVADRLMESVAKNHPTNEIEQYILFWKRIFSREISAPEYKKINNKLKQITIKEQTTSLHAKFNEWFRVFKINEQKYCERVQFFEDETIMSDSVLNEEKVEILVLNIQEVEEIRKKVTISTVQEVQAEEYALKLKNFVSFSLNTLVCDDDLKQRFKKQKIWSEKYLRTYKNYIQNQWMKFEQKEKEKSWTKNIPDIEQTIVLGNEVEEQVIDDTKANKTKSKRLSYNQEETKKEEKKKYPSSLIVEEQKKESLSQIYMIQEEEQIINQNRQVSSIPINNNRFSTENKKKQESYIYASYDQRKLSPKFIQNVQQLNQIDRKSMQSSKVRQKIFNNSSHVKQKQKSNFGPSQRDFDPDESDLVITKHGKKVSQVENEQIRDLQITDLKKNQLNSLKNQRNSLNQIKSEKETDKKRVSTIQPSNQNSYMTPLNAKKNFYANTISPGTAFLKKNTTEGFRRLSEVTQQKKLRKQNISKYNKIEEYLYLPYLQFFQDSMIQFSQFRKKCFEEQLVLYKSKFILIQGTFTKTSGTKIKVRLSFANLTQNLLSVQTLYRIPKSFQINKLTKIKKSWQLLAEENHVFQVNLRQFPPELCILNIKYIVGSHHQKLKELKPEMILLPITMRNFMNFLLINQKQWIQKWDEWFKRQNYQTVRNIIVDRNVVEDTKDLTFILKEFIEIPSIEGYSIKQYGGFCSQESFSNLLFIIRISQIFDNNFTLVLIANRKQLSVDQSEYLQYCLNFWHMLLGKIEQHEE